MDDRRSGNSTGRHHRSMSSVSALSMPASPYHTNLPHRSESNDSQRSSSGSPNSLPDKSNLSIEFDSGPQVIIRPNSVIRGKVMVALASLTYIARIRIKLRAEEYATVKIDEGGGDIKSNERIHQEITTFFEVDWKLWGNEVTAYSQSAWEEMEPGTYEYDFALKFPNVNYPPSIEEPAGFGVRFVWIAMIDGPALQTGIKSREYVTPYRPITVSAPDKEWVFRTFLLRDKKHPIAEATAKLQKQVFCPDDLLSMQLSVSSIQAEAKVTFIRLKFRKHHQGHMLVQQGTAFRESVRTVLERSFPIEHDENVVQDISFHIPTRLVSPSFTTRHTRVYYDIHMEVFFESGSLFKSTYTADFNIPVTIANLPYDRLTHIPSLTSITHYTNSRESPLFFDPSLDEPPQTSSWTGDMTALPTTANQTPMGEEPPSYFSIALGTSQAQVKKPRKERTILLSRSVRHTSEYPEAHIIPGSFDEDW